MVSFLREWGPTIITAVACIILIGIVISLRGTIDTNMKGIVSDFKTQTDTLQQKNNSSINTPDAKPNP